MSITSTLSFVINHPLNRHRRLKALANFLRWQVISRLAPGDVAYPWVNGTKFFVRKGETGLTGNIYAGLHEFEDMAFTLHFLRPGDLFVVWI